MELKNWYKTSFSNTEETIIEAPSNTHAAIVNGHLRNKSTTETSTVFIKTYAKDDTLKYSVPHIIEPKELKKLNSKLFIKDLEYITVSTDTSSGDVDAVFFGTEMLMEGATAFQGYAVSTTAPSDNQVLVWNDSTSQYEPEDIGTATTTNASQIQGHDVVSTTPSDNQALIWNDSTSQYEPQDISSSGDATQIQGHDVTATTAPSGNQVLVWNDSTNQYEPQEVNAVQIQGHDVVSTTPSDNQALIWNNSTSQYEPQEIISDDSTIQGYDVASTAPSDNQALIWNNSTSQYEPQEIISDDSTIQGYDVATTIPTDNQVLIWNDSNIQYEPGEINAIQIQSHNVASTAPSDNQVLVWNNSTTQYEPREVNAVQLQGYNITNGTPENREALIWDSDASEFIFEKYDSLTPFTITSEGFSFDDTHPNATRSSVFNIVPTISFPAGLNSAVWGYFYVPPNIAARGDPIEADIHFVFDGAESSIDVPIEVEIWSLENSSSLSESTPDQTINITLNTDTTQGLIRNFKLPDITGFTTGSHGIAFRLIRYSSDLYSGNFELINFVPYQ